MRLGRGMSRVGVGESKDIEHKHLFSDGGGGGADGLLSHLDDSSIFKRDLIETNSPLPESFKHFPLAPTMTGTSLSHCQSIPGSTRDSLWGCRCTVHLRATNTEHHICFSVRAIFTGLNLSFSQRAKQRERWRERVSGRNMMGASPNLWGKASALDREQISSS